MKTLYFRAVRRITYALFNATFRAHRRLERDFYSLDRRLAALDLEHINRRLSKR